MDDPVALVLDPRAQASAAAGISPVDGWPDSRNDEQLRRIVAGLERLPGLRVFASEFDDYGSGYASFVEVKLTRRDDSLVTEHAWGVETAGFGVLLNRLAPVAALVRGAFETRSPDGTSGSYSLPNHETVTACPPPDFAEGTTIPETLSRYGYTVLEPDALRHPLADGIQVATNLGGRELTVFDAWFHWYD